MSLLGDYDDGNIFAKVIRGEAPAAKVYEDADILAFMDLFPQGRGHTLVISKTARARNLMDVEPEALATLMKGVQKVAKAIQASLQPDGILLTQFNGAPAGQTVFHLHVHLIPRWEGVPLAGHGGAGMADPQELAAVAKEIGSQIR
jgi:histidine triad (HIT) family protein